VISIMCCVLGRVRVSLDYYDDIHEDIMEIVVVMWRDLERIVMDYGYWGRL
jgi:hypothetical protein